MQGLKASNHDRFYCGDLCRELNILLSLLLLSSSNGDLGEVF